MIHELNNHEIEEVFKSQYYGHLGCCIHKEEMYVVPLTYAYKDGVIYGFSFKGRKYTILQQHPRFCFQVEQLVNDTQWKSAMAWGTFKELAGQEREDGLGLLLDVLWSEGRMGKAPYMPFRNSQKTLETAKKNQNVVIFALTIEEQTGRMEVYE